MNVKPKEIFEDNSRQCKKINLKIDMESLQGARRIDI
jgi:hypothetical protein